MDESTQFDSIRELFERLGIEVRTERLGGTGGGLCAIRGKQVMFDDLDADLATRTEWCLTALANLPELDDLYVPPVLREQIDRYRSPAG